MRKGIHSYISQKLEKQMNGLPICLLSMSLTFIDRYSEGKIGNYAIILYICLPNIHPLLGDVVSKSSTVSKV